MGMGLVNSVVNTFDQSCVTALLRILTIKRKVFRKVNKTNWAKEFRDLRCRDGVDKKRIKTVLAWYIKHIGDEYIPTAFSASGFRDKFIKIEDAMERIQKDPKYQTIKITD